MIQNDPTRLPPFHFDADPDPAFKGLMLIRIRIQLPKLMRSHADPKLCLKDKKTTIRDSVSDLGWIPQIIPKIG
jgi:hypothetical protein